MATTNGNSYYMSKYREFRKMFKHIDKSKTLFIKATVMFSVPILLFKLDSIIEQVRLTLGV